MHLGTPHTIEELGDQIRQLLLPFTYIQEREAARLTKLEAHARRPLSEHISEWAAVIRTRAKAKHAEQTVARVRVIVGLIGATTWGDLTPAGIEVACGKIVDSPHRKRRNPLGLATVNHYLNSVKAFCAWMADEDQGRAERSPAARIRPKKAETDIRVKRRLLSDIDRDALLQATLFGPVIAGIPGYERAIAYELGWTTGLRLSELESLCRHSFHLAAGTPYVTVSAAYTKNAHEANQPLASSVALKVAVYLERVGRDKELFRFPANGTYALKKDLARAGIPYVINGERSDVHAHRHAYITDLLNKGLSLKDVQVLARHADARTTERYAHARPETHRAAIERLHVGVSGIDFARAVCDRPVGAAMN